MITRATINDIEAVVDLAVLLWPRYTREYLLESYEKRLADTEKTAVFVYVDNDRILGYADCSLRTDHVVGTKTSPVGFLEGIFVHDDARGKGIAGQLLRTGEDWARENGCTEFGSSCELSDILSLRFHKNNGFKVANRIVCLTKPL